MIIKIYIITVVFIYTGEQIRAIVKEIIMNERERVYMCMYEKECACACTERREYTTNQLTIIIKDVAMLLC
jgi:hypothetical protein